MELQALAERQGLLAVVLDGLDSLTHRGVAVDMPAMQKKMWIGQGLSIGQAGISIYGCLGSIARRMHCFLRRRV